MGAAPARSGCQREALCPRVPHCARPSPLPSLRAPIVSGFVPGMIKLFSLKEEKAKQATGGAASNPKIPPGLIRMQKGECRCRRLPLHARC